MLKKPVLANRVQGKRCHYSCVPTHESNKSDLPGFQKKPEFWNFI
jgi:hypothetical protein